jgi:hypothetical protein
MKVKSFFLVLMVFGLLPRSVGEAAATSDVSGTWTFEMQLPKREVEHPVFELKQEGEQVTGTYSGRLGKLETTGTAKDRAITLTVVAKNNQGGPMRLTFTGTMSSPSTMSGTLDMAGKFEVDWTAKRK